MQNQVPKNYLKTPKADKSEHMLKPKAVNMMLVDDQVYYKNTR